mgnify:CR=1 FL=1
MLDVRSVHHWFGPLHAVNGVSFSVRIGEVVGLLGPNGAGKTTTIRMIAGLLAPTSGRVLIDDRSPHDDPDARRQLGYLPESAPLYPEMSVDGFLDYRARLFGLSRAERRAGLSRVCQVLRLESVRRSRLSTLSKGFRQRVGLAGAILHQPRLVVLDEPANGLDPSQIREMRQTVRSLREHAAVVLSSHILSEIERTCDRIVMLGGGRVLADATPDELRRRADRPPTIELEVPAARADDVHRILRSLAGSPEVIVRRHDADWMLVEICPADASTPDLQTDAARALAEVGIVPRTLRALEPSLEDTFEHLLRQAPAQEVLS